MSEAAPAGRRRLHRPRQTMILKIQCPKCARANLENEVLTPEEARTRTPGTFCPACRAKWPNLLAAAKEAQAAGRISLDGLEGILLKTKAYIRGGRNIVERLRLAQRKARRAAAALRHANEEGAVSEAGVNLEDVVTSLLNSIDDARAAKRGEVKPFVGDAAEEDDAETR